MLFPMAVVLMFNIPQVLPNEEAVIITAAAVSASYPISRHSERTTPENGMK